MCLQQFDPSALKNYNVKHTGGSEHEIKQLRRPRERRERRAIYRITIENGIPASSGDGRGNTRRSEAAPFYAPLLLFCRNESVFISRGGCRWHRGAFLWTHRTRRKNHGKVLNKRVGVSGRGGAHLGWSQMFHLGWRAGRCTLAPSDRLVPVFLKLANRRGAGNLQTRNPSKRGGGYLWHGFALIFDLSTDQRQLIGLFLLAGKDVVCFRPACWRSVGGSQEVVFGSALLTAFYSEQRLKRQRSCYLHSQH